VSVVLYQYETCPFCNKVRAFLDYYNIPYTVVEVHPLSKGEIKFSKTYSKVPIVTVNGFQLNDSDAIINVLHNKLIKQKDPLAMSVSEDVEKWRQWNNKSLLTLFSESVYPSWSDSLQAFDYISTHSKFPPLQQFFIRYSGAIAMLMVARRNKKKNGGRDARAELVVCVSEWMRSIGNRPFHGGNQPDLADLSIFGVLRSLKNFRVWSVLENDGSVLEWYSRMEHAVGTPKHKPKSH